MASSPVRSRHPNPAPREELRPPYPPAGASPRVPELDGLRGAAILLVLIWHYFVSPLHAAPGTLGACVKQSLSLTWSGVDLFFVLSGFLIGGILIRNRDSPRYWSTFYIRRICRICPPYYLLITSYLGGLAAVRLGGWASIGVLLDGKIPFWSYLTFTQNLVMAQQNSFGADWLGVTWSLAIEEQFYLCLPLIVRLTRPRALPSVLLPLALAAPMLRLAFLELTPHRGFAGYVLMPTRADALLLGVLAAWALTRAGVRELLAGLTRELYVALVVLVAGARLLALRGPGIGPEQSGHLIGSFGHSWLALLYLTVLLLALQDRSGPIGWLTRRRWLRALGTISYAVYLIHTIILGLAHNLVLRQPIQIQSTGDGLVTLLALALTLALATLSWVALEKPILRWGHAHQY